MKRTIWIIAVFSLVTGLFLLGYRAPALAQEPGSESEKLVALGKALFFDPRLSANDTQSCAACHAPEVGWTGPDETANRGGGVHEGSVAGRFCNRKPPSVAYSTASPKLHRTAKGEFAGGHFWDGRATGEQLGSAAADQAVGPFLNPMEQALPDAAAVV